MKTVAQLAILAVAVVSVSLWPSGLTAFMLIASCLPIAAIGQA